MKSESVFSLNKLKESNTRKAYFDKGKGVFIKDPDGNEYLDFSASGCVANTGYCHPKVVEAIKRQAE